MRMYVGNATKQIFHFMYRVVEHKGVRTQVIHIGTQVALTGSLTQKDIDLIIEQNSKYGLVAYNEIDRTRGVFHGLCYAIDNPIVDRRLQLLFESNQEALIARGKNTRRLAAIATNSMIESELDQKLDGMGVRLKNLKMSAVEEEPRGGYQSDNPFSEGYDMNRSVRGG